MGSLTELPQRFPLRSDTVDPPQFGASRFALRFVAFMMPEEGQAILRSNGLESVALVAEPPGSVSPTA
jgi:hypothetical protein